VRARHAVADILLRSMSRSHHAVARLSGGRALGHVFGMPTVELHTTGRRTGRERVTMLTAPIADAGKLVLVASKGGDDRNPDWFANIVEHPDVVAVVGGERRAVRARVATSGERAELWPRVVAAYRGYAYYQRRTSREIPLVILEPRGPVREAS
jgi:deazaflavin-dependent oxidoreductase (nitroreductase family)